MMGVKGCWNSKPLIGQPRFRMGGTGESGEWEAIRAGVEESRVPIRSYLTWARPAELDRVYAYDGSFVHLHATGITARYALHRAISHHYFHIGEIATKRAQAGHAVGDYPGPLRHSR